MSFTDAMARVNAACVARLGQSAVSYECAGEDAVTISAIFDVEGFPEDVAPGTFPPIFIDVSDLPNEPANGDLVTLNSRIYKVANVARDSEGGAILTLQFLNEA